jgi:hypothetical protein
MLTSRTSPTLVRADKPISLNLPQLCVVASTQKDKYLEWGRGTGKSFILGKEMVDRVFQMPRATFALVGESYQQILTRTLPSTISGLAKLGYHKDLDYFIGRRPPKNWRWDEPFEPPGEYDHFMIWRNGAGFHLISQDRKGTGRGLNTCGVIGDEAALLDYETLFNDVLATIRAHTELYENMPLYAARTFASTVPMTQKGKWMYKFEEEARKNPAKILYLRASAMENKANLPKNWFNEQRAGLLDMIYNAEILNIRPGTIEGGFYPSFDDRRHTYIDYNYSHLDKQKDFTALDCRQDADLQFDEPIYGAFDWGGRINVLVAGQRMADSFNFINAMHVKAPKIAKDLAKEFCVYYQYHRKKHFILVVDSTAFPRDAGRYTTYAGQVMEVFQEYGWTVELMYIGEVPDPHQRFLMWSNAFSERDPNLPRPRLNRDKCKYLIISIMNAPIRQGRNGFEKDKSSEKHDSKTPQEEATHFSDAFDTLYFGLYGSNTGFGSQTFFQPRISNF